MTELARRSFLADSSDLIESVSVEAFSARRFSSITLGAVGSTLSALTSDVAIASGAVGNALVGEDGSGGALADSILGEGSTGTSSDTGSTDKVESSNTGGTGGG